MSKKKNSIFTNSHYKLHRHLPERRFNGNLVSIESSNIDKAGWYHNVELKLQVMQVVFRNKRVYDYFHVDKQLFEQFLASESKGQFLNQFIKNAPNITGEEIL